MALTDNLGSNVLSVIDTTPVLTVDLVIPATDWQATEGGYYRDVVVEESKADYKPDLVLDEASGIIAANCGMSSSCESGDGYVRFKSAAVPEGNMAGCLTLTVFSDTPGKPSSPLLTRVENLEDKVEEVDELLDRTAQVFTTIANGG